MINVFKNREQTMQATTIQLARTAKHYESLIGESVICEQVDNTMYVYGSELACLRLCYKMNLPESKQPRVEYSENLKVWFFSFEMFV